MRSFCRIKSFYYLCITIKNQFYNMEERNIKLEAMNKLISFSFNFKIKCAENSNFVKVGYPKFILDLWFDDRDFMLKKYLSHGNDFFTFYCSLDNSNKIKLLNYILDNYDDEIKLSLPQPVQKNVLFSIKIKQTYNILN